MACRGNAHTIIRDIFFPPHTVRITRPIVTTTRNQPGRCFKINLALIIIHVGV